VVGIHAESRSVSSFRFNAADGAPLPSALPGQFLTLRLPRDGGASLVRSYSLSGEPGTIEYRISVKQEEHGAASTYLHTRVKIEETVEVAAPRGTFTLRAGDGPVLLLSGVGATPVLAILHQLALERFAARGLVAARRARRIRHAFAAGCARSLRGSRTRMPASGTSRPAPSDVQGKDCETAGGSRRRRSARSAFRATPTRTCADRRLHAGADGRARGLRRRCRAHPHGDLRRRTGHDARAVAVSAGAPHVPDGPPGTGPAVTFARSGPTVPWDALREPARAGRGVQRAGALVVSDGRVPQLRAACSGTVAYSPDPVEPPAEGNDHLLLATERRGRPRPVRRLRALRAPTPACSARR
jgi:hypothetical protein